MSLQTKLSDWSKQCFIWRSLRKYAQICKYHIYVRSETR